MFVHVSFWGVLLAALSALIVGMIWYSPVLFGKPWMKIIGIKPKDMQKRMPGALFLLLIGALLTSYILALFIAYAHLATGVSWFAASMGTSLLAGVGFAFTAIVAHGVFDPRSTDLWYINGGNRIVTLVIMGLILFGFMH